MWVEVNSAYKQYSGNYIGHNLKMLAKYDAGLIKYYGSVLDNSGQCGPLLIINMNEQKWASACTIDFTYSYAEEDAERQTVFVKDQSVSMATYTDVGSATGQVVLNKGTREYTQTLFNTSQFIHEITDITVSDDTQHIRIYCLADTGTKLLHGFHNELIRDHIERLQESFLVCPPQCPYCEGTGEDPDGVLDYCPDCTGYKYSGKNEIAHLDWFDKVKAAEYKVKLLNESADSFKWRSWAKRWWITPVKDRIKEYISHFLRIDADKVDIDEVFGGYVNQVFEYREAYWVVRIPTSNSSSPIGGKLSVDDFTLRSIIDELTPAGTSVIILEYSEYVEGDNDEYLEDYKIGGVWQDIGQQIDNGGFNPVIEVDLLTSYSYGMRFGDAYWNGLTSYSTSTNCDAVSPAATYNGTGDSIIRISIAIDTILPVVPQTGKITIDGDIYYYSSWTSQEFTLRTTLTKDYVLDDVVVVGWYSSLADEAEYDEKIQYDQVWVDQVWIN